MSADEGLALADVLADWLAEHPEHEREVAGRLAMRTGWGIGAADWGWLRRYAGLRERAARTAPSAPWTAEQQRHAIRAIGIDHGTPAPSVTQLWVAQCDDGTALVDVEAEPPDWPRPASGALLMRHGLAWPVIVRSVGGLHAIVAPAGGHRHTAPQEVVADLSELVPRDSRRGVPMGDWERWPERPQG